MYRTSSCSMASIPRLRNLLTSFGRPVTGLTVSIRECGGWLPTDAD